MSVNRKIAKITIMLGLASVLGHALSLFKEVMVAKAFGITQAMDAYTAALSIPTFLNSVIMSVLGSMLIPVYIMTKVKDLQESNRIASVIINWALLISGAIVAAVVVFQTPIIRLAFKGFSPEVGALTGSLLAILALSVLLSVLVGILSGILNTCDNFVWPAYSQMFVTAATIFLVVFFAETRGVYVLAWGLMLGLSCQAVLLYAMAVRHGFSYTTGLRMNSAEGEHVLSSTLILIATSMTGQIMSVINSVIASHLPPGSVASLGYANKLVSVPITIYLGSVATVLFPFFSRQTAENRLEELKDLFAKSIRMTGFIFVPMTVMFVIFAKPLVRMLFQRGTFDSGATGVISLIFVYYSFQLFFNTSGALLVKIFLALQEFRLMFRVAAVTVGINIALNLLLIKLMNPPVAGIAAAASLTNAASMIIMLALLKRRLGNLLGYCIISGFAKISMCTAAMGAVTYAVYSSFGLTLGESTLTVAGALAAACGSGAAVYLLAAYMLRIEEFRSLLKIIRERAHSFFRAQGAPVPLR